MKPPRIIRVPLCKCGDCLGCELRRMRERTEKRRAIKRRRLWQ